MNYEQSSDNFTELLYDFLDGALAPENETRLFAALTQDADLRTELKEQLHINATIQTDEYAFTPPAASGEAIFARLGFAAEAGDTVAAPILASPTIVSPAITTVSLAARAGIAFRRGSSLVLVALLSSLLTAWLLHSSGNGYGGDINNGDLFSRFGNNGGNGYGGNGSSGAPPFHGSFAESGAGTSPQPFIIADTVFQTVIKRVIIRQEQAPSDATLSAAYPPLYPTLAALPETTQAQAATQAERTLSTNPQTSLGATFPKVMWAQDSTQKSAPTTTPAVQPATPTPLTGITIGTRGMVSRSIIWASVPAKETFPSNAALYALYSLSAHHSIGVEFGQESFFQRYYFTNPQGIEFRVEQNPTFVWGGLAYRYTMLPESTFSPFAHVVAGATQIGGLGRGMVGVSYAPDARTQFHLGAEAASLFYQSDGAWFISPKLGVSYGVSIKF
jgi:hypothetical protein